MKSDAVHDLALMYLEKHFDMKKTPREIAVLYREIFDEMTEALDDIGAGDGLILDAMGFALLHRYDGKSADERGTEAPGLTKLFEKGYLKISDGTYSVTEKGKNAMKKLLDAHKN